jgi:hypothetical protein
MSESDVATSSGLAETVVLELKDKNTGFVKQRKTIKNGVETDEFFAQEA